MSKAAAASIREQDADYYRAEIDPYLNRIVSTHREILGMRKDFARGMIALQKKNAGLRELMAAISLRSKMECTSTQMRSPALFMSCDYFEMGSAANARSSSFSSRTRS